ncbi:MAG: hypothetical protein H6747_13570 [Deltaproteobacteria bacterium]|nr:hypothetical protein [Deltaproteobacteria bacterium]
MKSWIRSPLFVAVTSLAAACSSPTGSTGTGTGGGTVTDTGGGGGTDTSGGGSDATGGEDGSTAVDSAGGTDTAGSDTAPEDTASSDTTATDGTTTTDTTATDTASTDTASTDSAGADSSDGTSTGGSCLDRCGDYDSAAACQCDSSCESYDDCCADYAKLCKKPDCETDADCDDKNACTKDSCVDKTSCKYEDANEGGACDDGRECTTDDKCEQGDCEGTPKAAGTACNDGSVCTTDDKCSALGNCFGTSKDCDDDNGCTIDSCDSKTGDCKHSDKSDGGYCSDGNDCTTEECKAGKCEATNKADGASCSDGNSCTKDTGCKAGVCESAPDESKNGDSCTDDDACTTGTTCNAGKCEGPANACDDDNPCTLDSCTPKSAFSKDCKNEPIAAGGKCDDGDPCTENDACTADAKCAATPSGKCKDALNDAFPCGSNGTWVVEPAADDAKGVSGWAVDESPAVEGVPSPKCTMNFNNGKDYDDKVDGKSVETKGTATSAEIDLTGATAAKGSFMLYYDIETSSSYDLFFVEISEDDFKTVAQSWQIPKTSDNKGKWHEQSADLTAFAGKKIKVRFRFDSKDTTSNSGKGVFIDDLKLVIVPKT